MAQSRKTIESVWAAKGNLPDSAIVATSDGKYPALDGSLITGIAGSGDMNASVYDPNTVAADAFARANHTGTQTASTISDFDTEVSNNTTVAAKADQSTTYTIGQVDDMLTFYPLTTEVDANLADKIDSVVTGEPTGSDVVLNVVSLTQAEYDAGTPVATTFYIITA